MDFRSLGGSRDNHRIFFSHNASMTILYILDNKVKFKHSCQE